MTAVAIPDWNAQGVIPPINELNPISADRSPYTVSLTDVVLRFGLSAERRTVLDGFLRYRAALHATGLVQGFQWLDGSFLEHVELLESRPPKDIDVVTFYKLPAGKSQQDLQTQAPDIFPVGRASQQTLKTNYHVDAYTVHLGMVSERLVPCNIINFVFIAPCDILAEPLTKGVRHVTEIPGNAHRTRAQRT